MNTVVQNRKEVLYFSEKVWWTVPAPLRQAAIKQYMVILTPFERINGGQFRFVEDHNRFD